MGNRQLGATEAVASNVKYLDLRIGKMAQTSKTQLPGFDPVQTENKAGDVFNFFAKAYDELYGYIERIAYYDKTLDNGTKLNGIKILIDCGAEKYQLDVGTKDRPYNRLLALLADVDYDRPVLFRAFVGKDKKTGHAQKVLLLSQEDNEEGKPIWLRAETYQEKYLSKNLASNLGAMTKELTAKGLQNDAAAWKDLLSDLSEKDLNNVALSPAGIPLGSKDYPYIRQKADEKWSFEQWEEFLYEKLTEEIIPTCQAAAAVRAQAGILPHQTPEFSGGGETAFGEDWTEDAVTADDDDIPF